MQSDGSDEGAHPACFLVRLDLNTFRRQVLVVDDEGLGDIAVAKVDDRRTAE